MESFSKQSDKYAQYRPTYPAEVYEFILANVPRTETVWDCGTGTGQVAMNLSQYFDQVYASDIHFEQIAQAPKQDNIFYAAHPVEHCIYNDNSFDLITVAQAIHWFDFQSFYYHVNRVLKSDGLFVVLGYGLLRISEEIDTIIDSFYQNVIGEFWEDRRKYIEESYQTIPFPFEEQQTPEFQHTVTWNLEHLKGYLSTWSAVKRFEEQKNFHPLTKIEAELEQAIQNTPSFEVHFPIFCRMGRKKN